MNKTSVRRFLYSIFFLKVVSCTVCSSHFNKNTTLENKGIGILEENRIVILPAYGR